MCGARPRPAPPPGCLGPAPRLAFECTFKRSIGSRSASRRLASYSRPSNLARGSGCSGCSGLERVAVWRHGPRLGAPARAAGTRSEAALEGAGTVERGTKRQVWTLCLHATQRHAARFIEQQGGPLSVSLVSHIRATLRYAAPRHAPAARMQASRRPAQPGGRAVQSWSVMVRVHATLLHATPRECHAYAHCFPSSLLFNCSGGANGRPALLLHLKWTN